MLIGAHVSAAGGLTTALGRAHGIGAEAFQVFTQSPRSWRPSLHSDASIEAFRDAYAHQAVARPVGAWFCHASYLINLATGDGALYERSVACLCANLADATRAGADGLVLHAGSHRGAGLAATLPRIRDGLLAALDAAPGACPILIENTAGAGMTVGATFAEIADLLRAAGDPPRLGACLDTQHLWASGVDYASRGGANAVVAELEATIALPRLRCLHLNDSKVPLGAAADRHANIGEGTVGRAGLAWLVGHPALDGVPAILEVPGPLRKGPDAAEVRAARQVLARGRRAWTGRR